MKLEKIHIVNFRCIKDSGIVDIEDLITILLGKNESGKTSFLKALECFNIDSGFDKDDLCDFTKGEDEDAVCTLTAWLRLSEDEQDLKQYFGETIKITKLLGSQIIEDSKKVIEEDQFHIPNYYGDLWLEMGSASEYFNTKDYDKIIENIETTKKIYKFESSTNKNLENIIADQAISIVEKLVKKLEGEKYRGKEKGKITEVHKRDDGSEHAFIVTDSGTEVYADWSEILTGHFYESCIFEEGEEIIFNVKETDYSPRKPPHRIRTNLKAINIIRIEFLLKQINKNVIERFKPVVASNQKNFKFKDAFYQLRNNICEFCKLDKSDLPHIKEALLLIARLQLIPLIVLHRIPRFIYIDEYDELEDSVNIKEFVIDPSKHKTLLYLLQLAELELNELTEANTPKSRANISKKLSNSLTKLIKPYWTQSKQLSIEMQIEENRINILINDKLGNLIPLSKRSKGFQWYMSFIINLVAQSQDKSKMNVILLDDPGPNLHPVAQKDMIKFLEFLTQLNQTILTTHSPFLLDPGMLFRIRTAIRRKTKRGGRVYQVNTKISSLNYDKDIDAFDTIRAAIGMTVAETLLISSYNLIVSGYTDNIYIKSLNKCLEILDIRITIYPLTGDAKFGYFVHIFDKGGSNFLVLLDADNEGVNTQKQLIDDYKIDKERIIMISNVIKEVREVEIEDLFSDVFYNEMVNRVYANELNQRILIDDLKKDKKQTEQYKIWFYRYCKNIAFEKGQVAEAIGRLVYEKDFKPEEFGTETLDNFFKLFSLINSKFNL